VNLGQGGRTGEPALSESAVEWPTVGLTLCVDGHEYPVPQVWIGDSLLAVLRERLDLDEPRDGCSVGECGACLVTLDGTPAASCLVPAVAAVERDVRTPGDATFDAARAAIQACGASPCGFCAPGLAVAITSLLRRNPDPGPAAVREALGGVVCRCSESGRWIEAVALAKEAEDTGPGGVPAAWGSTTDDSDPADHPANPNHPASHPARATQPEATAP
jgi:aerobic-type carbon monoxide dehydrogenase small subunit (CoxS/CutS family)